ncbi:MAG: RES family NAD+ phosphorylase [Acidobacteriota bacterium]|nr:MAG: RES family NAD+ phosphorylase [Acidobacteriota bacterium]
MTLSCFRTVKEQFAADPFSGDGAYEFGGRWNSPGSRVLYASESLALACLEMLVHLDKASILRSYVFIEARFEEKMVVDVEDLSPLPADWHNAQGSIELQTIGDEWIATGSTPVLRVPSAVIPRSFNFLINPAHKEFSKVAYLGPEPIDFDPRLK